MRKYKDWEIIVAALLPLVTIQYWFWRHDSYDTPAFKAVSIVCTLIYLAVIFYTFFRMYLGAKATHRFPTLMLLVLIFVTATHLYELVNSFIPYTDHTTISPWMIIGSGTYLVFYIVTLIADIRLYREGLTTVAFLLTCLLVLPLLTTIGTALCGLFKTPVAAPYIVRATSLLTACAYAVLFLHRNDIFRQKN